MPESRGQGQGQNLQGKGRDLQGYKAENLVLRPDIPGSSLVQKYTTGTEVD